MARSRHGQEYLGVTEGGEVEVDGKGDCAINFAEASTHVLLEPLHMHSQQRRTPAQRTATTQFPDANEAKAEELACAERHTSNDQVTVVYNKCIYSQQKHC